MTTTNGYWSGSISYTDQYGNSTSIPVGSVDEDGIFWYWLSLTGWDGAPVVGSVTQRTADHGGWANPQYYGPRVMNWTVYAQAPDQATRDLARSKFQRSVPVNDFATFVYNEPTPKTAQVRRSGNITESALSLTEVTFSCPMVAPDPRKYNATSRSFKVYPTTTPVTGFTLPVVFPLTTPTAATGGNTVLLPNNGDFATRPIITLYGPVTSPTFYSTATGQTVTFQSMTLFSGDVLVLDFDNRVATRNGSIVLADLTSSWWEIPPGGTEFVLGGSFSNSSMATVTYADAWQ